MRLTVFAAVIAVLTTLASCGEGDINTNRPTNIPKGCFLARDGVVIVLPLKPDPFQRYVGVKVWNVICPKTPTTQPDAGTPTTPTESADAGTTDDPSDAGTPPTDEPDYVRYNEQNGKCFKLNEHQIDPKGQHHGWTVVTTDEVPCPKE